MKQDFFQHLQRSMIITIVCAFVCLAITGFILMHLGHWLSVEENIQQGDAIIVVSGGGRERVQKGIELYLDGYADQVIFTGGTQDGSRSNANTMMDYAKKYPIDPQDFWLEHDAKNTYENALYTKAFFPQSPEKIIVVSSSYHQKRASQIFRLVYDDTEIYNAPADVDFWEADRWWHNQKSFSLTLSESLKILWGNLTGIWG